MIIKYNYIFKISKLITHILYQDFIATLLATFNFASISEFNYNKHTRIQ